MERNEIIQASLDISWHRQTAEASLERWVKICDKEKWGNIPRDITRLIAIFGASWYFTRFIFYHGRKSANLIDNPVLEVINEENLLQFLSQALQANEQEQQFEWLRSLKNQVMLQILLKRLSAEDELRENESALTCLAIASLKVAMEIVGLDLKQAECEIAVLGMGRIAGYEMNYGSDLDLIFLYNNSSDDFRTVFSEKIRFLLRNMSLQSATGALYEIDMRLRPHGTSGALVTSVSSFLDYHSSQREIWERQMMTRCLPVVDYHQIGSSAMQKIGGHIYQESYDDSLATEILQIRSRVLNELGKQRGKYDVKRGRGGIMDIDFLTHFLQLKNGHQIADLRTSSTRSALSGLASHNILSKEQTAKLLSSYDYLKKIESCLRLFDLKSVNTFSTTMENDSPLVRAMGYLGKSASLLFMEEYQDVTDYVHTTFTNTLNEFVS